MRALAVPVSYVLPLRARSPRTDLVPYLESLAQWCAEVIVVDGSAPAVFAAHAAAFPAAVVHLPVDADLLTPMGKVGGVLTGLRRAGEDHVVIADDDVRWTEQQLAEMDGLLNDADVVRPQNHFEPLPWHARWDTGRILINRALGGDWPGTLGVRRSSLPAGYAGDVLFENLELVRTVRAGGGREHLALGLLVARVPPETSHFVAQRVRQAYDEWARPGRLLVQLAIVPALLVGRVRAAAVVLGGAVALAEVGRRRAGGTTVFRPTAALWAPVWVAERAITSWLAVASKLRYGGVGYGDTVLRRAATPTSTLAKSLT